MNTKNSTVKLVYIAVLVALSFIGSLIKIQGSIALDSMPGFFAALLLGPGLGALVAALGHVLTAMTSGFPLTIIVHLVITIMMAISAYVFGKVYKKSNIVLASIIGIILNAVVELLILAPITKWLGFPLNGWPFFLAMIWPLTLASAVNIILAGIIYELIGKRILTR